MPSLRRFGVVVLVVALTVGDAALVYAAVQRSHRADTSSSSVTGASADVTPTTGGTPATTPATTPSSQSPGARTPTKQSGATVVPASDESGRLLTATGTTTAWRAHGGCAGPPKLAMTTDGARTWSPVTSPAPHLLRIELTGATSGWAVGVNASCGSPTYYATDDAGATWSAAPTLGTVWLPLQRGVLTPGGTTTNPCGKHTGAIQLAPSGNNDALVICPTGVKRTTNSGASWSPVGTLPAGQAVGVALGQPSDGILVLAGAPHCGGLRVLTSSNSGGTWTKGDCLSGAMAPAALSVTSDGGGLLVSAGRAYTTTDGGQHWS